MILRQPASLTRRRTAFTLLEVLVVVAIILVLASVATVSVLEIQKRSKADIALAGADSLANCLRAYMVQNGGTPPNSLDDILHYVEGNDPSKLLDPWGQKYQFGTVEKEGITSYYVYTKNFDTNEEIRSGVRKQ